MIDHGWLPADSVPSRADHANHADPASPQEPPMPIANIAEAYGFIDADHEELTGVRDF